MKLSAKLRILIVDDSQESRNIIKTLLKKKGFKNVLSAEDGNEALEVLQKQYEVEEPIELIFGDLKMPKMGGDKLLTTLKGTPSFASIPFIMVTAVSDKDAIMEAVTLGVDNYIVKPLSGEKLFTKIQDTFLKLQKKKAA